MSLKLSWRYRNMRGWPRWFNLRFYKVQYELIVLSNWYRSPYGKMNIPRALSIMAERIGLTKFHCKLRGYK